MATRASWWMRSERLCRRCKERWNGHDCGSAERRKPLSDEGAGLALQVVLEAETDRRMHVECIDLGCGEELDLDGFPARPQVPPDNPAGEADRELLAHLAVVVGEDVARVGVDADYPFWFHSESGLLLHFPGNRLGDALADVHDPSGQRPPAVVASALEQDASLFVGHDRRSARHER